MNHEKLLCLASIAIVEFNRLNVTSCVLQYENGEVKAYPNKDVTIKPSPCLVITPWQQENGLTATQWHNIGCALFSQFNMETAK